MLFDRVNKNQQEKCWLDFNISTLNTQKDIKFVRTMFTLIQRDADTNSVKPV